MPGGKRPGAGRPRGSKPTPASIPTLASSRRRKEAALARKQELVAARLAGELVSIAVIQQTWATIVAAARARLLAIPSRVGPRVAGLDAAEASELLRREIYEALHELARSDLEGGPA